MSKLSRFSGFALIEVLIAAFVVGVGFLALTSLQGKMTAGSRVNKTRAEAIALANTKMEELRSAVDKAGYDKLISSSDSNIPGKTENFNRSWLIEPQTGSFDLKKVTVVVCWPSNSCLTTNPEPDKSVELQSFISLDSLAASMLMARNNDSLSFIGGPSTNAESSDDIRDSIHLETAQTVGTLINKGKYIVDGNGTTSKRAVLAGSCDGLNNFENGLKTRRIDNDNVLGNESIELYRVINAGGSQYCTPEIRYNGGVIIPIRGIVHSRAITKKDLLSVELFSFNASETGAYCHFKPYKDLTGFSALSAPYVCYIGGNCSGVTDAQSMDDTDVTKCPINAYSAEKVGPGGWRGKVGLRGIAGSSSYFNVCFAEEIATTPPLTLDSAREYYSRRKGLNEGINKPYSGHDFMIVDGQSTNKKVNEVCKLEKDKVSGVHLVSKTVERNLGDDNSNIFDPSVGVPGASDNNTLFDPSHNIQVKITFSGNFADVYLSVNWANGKCSKIDPDNFKYSCQEEKEYSDPKNNILSFALSSVCSNTKDGDKLARKKYSMTANSITSEGTGQLVIDLGTTMTATVELTVTESTTPCE